MFFYDRQLGADLCVPCVRQATSNILKAFNRPFIQVKVNIFEGKDWPRIEIYLYFLLYVCTLLYNK